MKIHVWVQSYASSPGGIQTFSRFVVRALRDLYPEAEIVVFSKSDKWYSFPQNEPATKVVCFGQWSRVLRPMALAIGLIRAGIASVARIRQQSDGVPTIIVSTHVNFAPVARWLKRLARVSFVAVGHGIEVWEIGKRSVRESLRTADQLVAVSDFTRQRMASALGLNPDRIELLPNTFDAEKFRPGRKPPDLLKRYGLTSDQPVILTVARLAASEQYKGYDQVLRALPAVLKKLPDARYIIVGDGPDRKRVEELSKELGVEESLTLAGYVPSEELSAHYNLCDVFVMPSKGEGFGIVFLEALGCGKPVIAGNKDGSVEAVLNGELGMLVDPDDVEAIGEALNSQLSTLKLSSTPMELRRGVMAAYGYDRFRERLGEIVEKLNRKGDG